MCYVSVTYGYAYIHVLNIFPCIPEMFEDLVSELRIERLGTVEGSVHHRGQRQQRLGVRSSRGEIPDRTRHHLFR